MCHRTGHWMVLSAGCLLTAAVLASAVHAAPPQNLQTRKPGTSNGSSGAGALSGRLDPSNRNTPPIGRDWRRTYPWSPSNAWSNPYWYPPYNRNYPFPPYQAYLYPVTPVYPYPVPRPYPYPVPTPYPLPYPGLGAAGLGQ